MALRPPNVMKNAIILSRARKQAVVFQGAVLVLQASILCGGGMFRREILPPLPQAYYRRFR